jgi:hypothetical protein
MWTAQGDKLDQGIGLRGTVFCDAEPASFAQVMRAWQTEAEFRSWFNALLADVPYPAFRWETPPLTAATVTRAFEFVVLEDPSLARRPAPQAFAAHFRGAPAGGVVEFSNLGGDAILVVPCPISAPSAYGHLAAFVRGAPEEQRDALWRTVGDALARRVNTVPVWLSTAGAGVPWLHVRLDNRPKYYCYGPYRQKPT